MTRRGKEEGWGPRARVTPAIQPALLYVASFSVHLPPNKLCLHVMGKVGVEAGAWVRAWRRALACRDALFLHLGMTHATARPLSTLARPLSTQLLALFLHSPSFYTLLLCSAIARIVAMRRCIVCVCLCTCCSFQRSVCLKKNRALTNSKQQFLLLF